MKKLTERVESDEFGLGGVGGEMSMAMAEGEESEMRDADEDDGVDMETGEAMAS